MRNTNPRRALGVSAFTKASLVIVVAFTLTTLSSTLSTAAPAETAGASFSTPAVFPTSTGHLPVATHPLRVPAGTTVDFRNQDIAGTTSGRSEFQQPVVIVEPGATVKNLIIAAPAADGVHCLGSCTLDHVWWPQVGEDAATLQDGSPADAVMKVIGGGARHAYDKVFQLDGAGTAIIRNFSAEDIGALVLSCGQCIHQYQRHIAVYNSLVSGGHYHVGGINRNDGDTADFADITIIGKHIHVCQESIGHTDRPAEYLPYTDPDASCRYNPATISYRP
ncbi:pectate lyase [Curtobacterium flaccumfaciens]|uniref:pectate lyase n=1 Tax=Curtobacterium flaccumfaciens TaxID=2035 RepID=UPI001E2F104D|nr:pectate lyase [Curtobacterium allii]MCE0459711.1 pectate lyase [Curtobacterium allii]